MKGRIADVFVPREMCSFPGYGRSACCRSAYPSTPCPDLYPLKTGLKPFSSKKCRQLFYLVAEARSVDVGVDVARALYCRLVLYELEKG